MEFLGADFQPITNPYIATVQVQSIENPVGIHKVSFTVPNGNYTIPNIRLTNLTTIYRQILVTNTVVDCEAPVPTPVFVPSPAPVPMPTPIITPSAPTPVFVPSPATPAPAPSPIPVPSPVPVAPSPVPVACNCLQYLFTPIGFGPSATWTVWYTDCNGVPQSTSGNGLDDPRTRYACVDSVSSTGFVTTEIVGDGGGGSPSPVPPTPIAPTPSPAPNLETIQCSNIDSFLNNSAFVYSGNYSAIAYKNANQYYIKNGGSINQNSVLSIMSCTKAITAALIFKLRELSLVDLDAPISDYLSSYLSYGQKKDITLKMILGHTTGLPADTPYEQDTSSTVSVAANLIGQNSPLSFVPGTSVQYSSAAYQLAASVAEQVASQPFKALCNTYIFTPLGITAFRWTTTPNIGSGDNTENNPIAGYGLSMSAFDYAKFVRSMAGIGVQILNSSSRALMFSDATGNIDPYFGYGVLRRDVSGGASVVDIHMKGASGCYGFVNTDTSYSGVVFNTSGIQNVDFNNELFSSNVRENLGSCPVTPNPAPTTPTPVGPNPYNIYYVANGTGSSFSAGSPDGISPNKRNFFTKMANNKVNYIKHAINLGEYSPAPGVYNNAKLSESINWIRSLPNNPKVDILMIPHLKIGDPRTVEADLQLTADGHYPDCTLNLSEVPSNYSPNAIAVIDEIYDRFLTHIRDNHSNDVRGGSAATGNSEEHSLPYASNYNGGPGCGNNGFGSLGDYSFFADQKWKLRQTQMYQGNLPYPVNGTIYQAGYAPLTYIPSDNQNNRFVDLSREDIREVIRFWNQGVYDVWEHFIDKWVQYFPNGGTHPTEIFYADFFNPQGIQWTMCAGTMHKCLTKANVLYHTHNLSPSDWVRNLVGTDVIKGGTYGNNKLSDIEFDSTDLGGPNGEPIDKVHLKRAIVKFINHGGNGIHFVLDWTDQQLDDIGQVMQEIYDEYINNPNWVPEWVTKRPTADVVTLQTHNMFNDANYIMTAWKSTGNSEADPFNAKIMNIRVQDTFWTIPNPNPGS